MDIPLPEDACPLDKATMALYLLAFCLVKGICDSKASKNLV